MIGKIVKGISGFYYIHVVGSGIYECKAKGVFRKRGEKPLVGDDVRIDILDEEAKLGNITELLPRKNELIRPAVANVDQALVIFAVHAPEPNFNLLDRFLVMMEYQDIPVHICFNKSDLLKEQGADALSAGESEMSHLRDIFNGTPYQVHFISADTTLGQEQIQEILKGKTTTVAGPSGVGKSTLINALQENIIMETGGLSEKISRGKHTTRHSELIPIAADTFIMDTPGFSSLYLPEIEKESLREYYPEFLPFTANCRFNGCVHMNEPDCAVKEAVEAGQISRVRYSNYRQLYDELASIKKY